MSYGAGLCQVLRNHTFVGMANSGLTLLQYQTKLYLADLSHLTYDLFYQQVCSYLSSPISVQFTHSLPSAHCYTVITILGGIMRTWQHLPGMGVQITGAEQIRTFQRDSAG